MTAETAVVIPLVAVLMAGLLVTGAVVAADWRCADAARQAARAAALGEHDDTVVEVARRVAGAGVEVALVRDGEWVTVTTSTSVGPGPLAELPWRVDASATARVEP